MVGGVEVFVGATGDALCPVQATVTYSSRRGDSPGLFFRTDGGVPLSKARFVDGVRSALTQAGIAMQGYSGHSFRIGAATAAASAGIQDSVIGQVVQLGVSHLHPYPKGCTSESLGSAIDVS